MDHQIRGISLPLPDPNPFTDKFRSGREALDVTTWRSGKARRRGNALRSHDSIRPPERQIAARVVIGIDQREAVEGWI